VDGCSRLSRGVTTLSELSLPRLDTEEEVGCSRTSAALSTEPKPGQHHDLVAKSIFSSQ